MAARAVLSAHSVAPSIPQFNGLSKYRTNLGSPQSSAMPPINVSVRTRGKGALGARCGFIGSPTNLIMVTTTSLMLFAGRFGLAPSTSRVASAGLKLLDRESGLQTGDPAGFTATDTLACGSLGHIIGVGIVLGLKATGAI